MDACIAESGRKRVGAYKPVASGCETRQPKLRFRRMLRVMEAAGGRGTLTGLSAILRHR
jgi:hypothetical protein